MDGSPEKYHFSCGSNKQDGRHRQFFWLDEFQIFFFYSNEFIFTKPFRNDSWMVLSKFIYKFLFRLNNMMAAKWIILIGRFSNIFFSETTVPNSTKFYRINIWMFLRNNTTFSSGWTNKMAARADSFFWLADFLKSSLKYWAKFNQTLQELCTDGPAQKYHLSLLLNQQHGSQSPVERYRPSWASCSR